MRPEEDNGLPPEVFERLLAKYRESIPDRLKAISEAIEMLKREPSGEALAALRFLVHKMAGNAGTFGYEGVTRLCRIWETKLSTMAKEYPNCKVDISFFSELEAFFKKIREEFGPYGR